MQKKNKRSAAEELINNVLEDLKQTTEEPSISFASFKANDKETKSQSTAQPNALAKAFLSPGGEDRTAVSGPPEGLNSSVLIDANAKSNQTVQPVDDKTEVLPNRSVVSTSSPLKPQVQDQQQPTVNKTLEPAAQVSFGSNKPIGRGTPYDAQLLKAENLKIAQARISELEKMYEEMRKEAEILSSANEVVRNKLEDYQAKIQSLERIKQNVADQHESEIRLYREGLAIKENEISRLKLKNEELEGRLAHDLRKIRARERELENRLELAKLEKNALVRSKDENILDLKRKLEHLNVEVDNYKNKVLELNSKIESNQDQFGRTVRALRLALTNLEVNENTGSITIAPIKKAE